MPTLKSYIDQWFQDHLDDREAFNLQTDVKTYSLARVLQTISNQLDTSGGTSPGGTAGGDLAGTYPNPTIATGAITSTKIAASSIGMTHLKFYRVSVTGTGSSQIITHPLGVTPTLVLPVIESAPDGAVSLVVNATSSLNVTVTLTATLVATLLIIA